MPSKEIIYHPDPEAQKQVPKLVTGSVANFCFNTPHAELDDARAFVDVASGTTLSRAQLYDQSLRLGYAVDSLGFKFKKGVAMIFSPNSLAWPIVYFGLQTVAVTTTLANSAYTPPELAHQIKDSDASLLFVHPLLFPTLLAALELLKLSESEIRKRVVIMSYVAQDTADERSVGIDARWTRLGDLLKKGKLKKEIMLSPRETDQTAMMCYSSGTTGLSKGVQTSHRNIVSVCQIYRPYCPSIDRTKNTDVELCILPFYHIFGIVKILCFSFWYGIPAVIVPKFEPTSFMSAIEKYRVTIIKVVPPVLVVLASHPDFESYDLSSLRFFLCGAAPLGEGLVTRLLERFNKKSERSGKGNSGLIIAQGYGLTETSPTALVLMPNVALEPGKIGSTGTLAPHLQARLVDDNGNDALPNEEDGGPRGELWLRGPTIMNGYLNNPTATRNSITKDGWFKTGDIAVRDKDGFYFIVDRKKELIKYKGFQVPPADLEAVLLTKDDIADVCVIGVESEEQATELPRAYIVSTKNATLLKDADARAAYEKEVQEWIKAKVASHKYLRGGVRIVEVIPKSGSGKILRRQVRDLAKQEAKEQHASKLAAPGGGPKRKVKGKL